MSGKLICLITGGNRGLGFEAAKNLLQSKGANGMPYHIILGSRDKAQGQSAAAELEKLPGLTGTVSAVGLDVTSDESVAAAATEVTEQFGRLDALVNNAGIFGHADTAVERLKLAIDTNVIGVTRVTEAFLPLLLKEETFNPTLVFVGSSMGSLAGASDTSSRYYRSVVGSSPMEYRTSKVAVNMLMVEYWKKYGLHEGGRLRVYTADPGPNATGFLGLTTPEAREAAIKKGVQTADVGAKQLAAAVKGERDGGEGKMWGVYGQSPW